MWDSSGPPSMRLFLSTSAHNLGISLRNKFSTLRSVCLNDRFSCSRKMFTSLNFVLKIPLSVRHQNIYSHLVDCTRAPWESLTIRVIFLALVIGSHHWRAIKWFLPCSTSDHCNHMDRIVLCGRWDEYPGCLLESTHSFLPKLRWHILYEVPAWIHICMVVAMLKFASVWHRYTLYIW